MAGWLAGWLADWLAGWVSGWVAGWLASWLAYTFFGIFVVDSSTKMDATLLALTFGLAGWLAGVAGCLAVWLAGWLAGWLACASFGICLSTVSQKWMHFYQLLGIDVDASYVDFYGSFELSQFHSLVAVVISANWGIFA